ncbi:MAG: S23 ribosomal protein family protein [Parcubacteria group bacterium GW2011_GWB1_43_8]|nr:MAG: S23 ribosomal protein family protein [Parcubacteria group bacterium GW2011_GWB1_43_8]
MINSYKDLIVWQRAIELVVEIYKLTDKFPKSEIYGLVSQMRRSAVSIPSNIAEGRRRGTKKDYRNFLVIAYGSGAELETQIIISKKLSFGIMDYSKADSLLDETMKMLNKFLSALKD